ncbi:MipA/OmpV family protein [Aurantiacibacter flavus]|uniref:MipA/OmpV family protein n=1 Tax=Aurantiacibacter flavus TaxID=3145232 RepID=A0ABV0D1L5_9SPHN
MRKTFCSFLKMFVSAGALLSASSALAQTSTDIRPPLTTPDGHDIYAGDDDDFEEDHLTIGVGGMYQPKYLGARGYEFQPILALDWKSGNLFANFEDGLGVMAIDDDTFSVGAGIVPIFDGYDRKDVPNGFNKVDVGAGVRGFASVRQAGFEATAGVTQIFVGSTKGVLADFSIAYDIEVNDRLFISPSVGVTWANAKHTNRFYGVSAQQSADSGLPEFRPGAGFLDAEAQVFLQYRLTDHLGLGVGGGVSTLLDNAKDSPIVSKRTAPTGTAFLTYTF